MTKKAVETVETSVETVETSVETVETNQLTLTSSIKTELDDLDVNELNEVINWCSNKIDDLQREEVEALEAEMRAIQDKLLALKGRKPAPLTIVSGEAKRTANPIVNPDNPSQVYKFGRTPDWLAVLMAKTGKTITELRNMA